MDKKCNQGSDLQSEEFSVFLGPRQKKMSGCKVKKKENMSCSSSPYEPEIGPRCIITPVSLSMPRACPQQGCLTRKLDAWPLEQWAQDYTTRPRVNVDGLVFPNNLCAGMCDHRNNPQFIGVMGKPKHSYRLPGGMANAIQFFGNCAACV